MSVRIPSPVPVKGSGAVHNAQACATLKVDLALLLPDNLDRYADVKDAACDLIFFAAEAWAQASGWNVGTVRWVNDLTSRQYPGARRGRSGGSARLESAFLLPEPLCNCGKPREGAGSQREMACPAAPLRPDDLMSTRGSG